MELNFQTSRVMHEDHTAVLTLMERLSSAMSGYDPMTPPESLSDNLMQLLRELPAAIEGEIGRHFDFEEQYLFPMMVEAGDTDTVDLLLEQHGELRPVGGRLAVLSREAQANGFSAETWAEFTKLAAEYVDRLSTHAQMEEGSMVPMIDDLLESERDNELANIYRAMS